MNLGLAVADEAAATFSSPLRYPGGKQKAIATIAPMLPNRASVYEYREPMVGGGSMFFHVRSMGIGHQYWINDKFAELATFWQVAQNPELCARLQRELEELRTSFKSIAKIKQYFLAAREEPFENAYRTAFLFFFFNRVTFSGTTRAGGFSKEASTRRFTASSITKLASLPAALQNVRITNLDYEEVIYQDGKYVFMFLDPPYFSASRLYGKNGSLHEFDHKRLSACLKETDHRFLITYDDVPEIRRLYKWANITEWKLQYGMNNCNQERMSKIGNELFITNYEIGR
jgi:DNA adenine methylase